MSIFDTTGLVKKPRLNKFNLDKEILMTANLGNIYPIYSKFLVPGDFFSVTPNCVAKTAPMYHPIYSSQSIEFHAFAIPIRLLWNKFDKWRFDPENVEHKLPNIGQVTVNNMCASVGNNLCHNLGFPYHSSFVTPKEEDRINCLDFIAYHRICNDYFRNPDLQQDFLEAYGLDAENMDLEDYDTVDFDFFTDLHRRLYRRDYFTSCLPFPQRGSSPSIGGLVTGEAPIMAQINRGDTWDAPTGVPAQDRPYTIGFVGQVDETGIGSDIYNVQRFDMLSFDNVTHDGPSYMARIYADLGGASSGVSVSDLRVLFALDKYAEISAIVSTRIVEGTLAYYGVRVPDSRAQRAEFLGMCRTQIVSSEVVATGSSNGGSTLGELAGVGHTAAFGRTFRYFAYEHCILMVVMSSRPQSYYFQGIPRHYHMLEQFDIPTPIFQHLGEQPVYNSELFYDGTYLGARSGEFGYQSRYAEIRSELNEIRGLFATTLMDWHLGRAIKQQPNLNDEFIEVQNPTALNDAIYRDLNDVYNYSKQDPLWISLFLHVNAKRPFKYHTQPYLIG